MKNLKPIQIVFFGAVAQVVILVVLLFLYRSYVAFLPLLNILAIALLSGLISFGLSFYFFKKYIQERLDLIFRIIDHGTNINVDQPKIEMRQDPIGEAAKASVDWANARKVEIAKLKEQAAFRREFLGNLAHELKTPVFSIQGYILTLLEGGLEDEKVNRKFLERAAFSTERMSEILEDLDQIMKLEVNRVEIKKEAFDIVDLTKDLILSFEERSQEKGVEVKLAERYEPIYVNADKSKIAQVITNLIANSLNYSSENGKTTIRFYEINNTLMTEVADNGIGIEEKNIPRLFERFYRVEQSRNRNEGGSGLGLAICKHIIESHNETIAVKSKIGVGSTFSFSLKKSSRN
ncbi:sensor histidine kinase [Brumimicrobium oceani]|uniref:histidine kinase n=1 Tax=Brumimicrobium oceani TaxID=2100725 RepID=A0A2U2XB22_9FLAO|nr:ATP-binding protein [Brumimicrobium oceani]PWH84995.1 two-component sensor histidine kinase [Brumimicrobium oceani]